MRRFLLTLALASSLLTMLSVGPAHGHGPASLRADGCTTQPGGTCPH